MKGPAGKYMVLDGITVRNLEIVVNNTTGGSEGTLLGRLDSCNTAMGRRVLRHWVVAPLLQVSIYKVFKLHLSDLFCSRLRTSDQDRKQSKSLFAFRVSRT